MGFVDDHLGRFLIRDDQDYVAELGQLDSKAYLASTTDLRDEVWASIKYPEQGLWLPWYPETDLSCFVPRRWTIWSGRSFSGKTQLLRFIMLWAMWNKHRVFFCSLEESPYEVLRELVFLAAMTRQGVTEEFVEWCCEEWAEKLWIFNHTGFIDPFVVLGAVCYAARTLGVTQVVIDSLMKLDIRKDDWDGQRRLANEFDRVTRQMNVHLHLVVHPRKSPPATLLEMDDIEGAKDLTSQSHGLIIIDRIGHNAIGKQMREKYEIPNDVDALYRQLKQRGDHNLIGTLPLYFDRAARQWKFKPYNAPMRMIHENAHSFCGVPLCIQGELE